MGKLKPFAISCAVILLLALVACDASTALSVTPHEVTPTPVDMLGQMFDAQDRATSAAATAQRISSYATTSAQATREYVVLQGQQTRIAQDSRATQTVFASNVQATESARSANQTRYAEDARATNTAVAINATATVQAAHFTATAYVQNANATATAQTVAIEATRASASATATANAVIVDATRASASATATANAASAVQTQVAAMAIQTRTSEETQTISAKQNWERTTESVRSVAAVVGIVLAIIGGLCIVGFLVWRFADATILRIRVIRDANGVPFVITEADHHGRREMLAPSRAPGAVTLLTPPQAQALQIGSGATDGDVTRRDQAIGLMLAAGSGRVNAIAGALEDDETAQTTGVAGLTGGSHMTIFKPFEARTLELADAPRLALPMGTTAQGEPLWIPFQDVTHALIGGPSGMGKTNLVHGWIQALQQNDVRLELFDGKEGLEFNRYALATNTHVITDDLPQVLGEALGEMKARFELLAADGATNIQEYNRARDTDERMPHQAIVIDELYDALQDEVVSNALNTLASKARAIGIHLIMATQLPDAGSVPKHLRINALLRVAFACPSHTNSNAILGYSGAEKIEKTPGRLLVFWQGKLIEAQAFKTVLPPALPGASSAKLLGEPTSPFDEETRRMVEWAIQQGGGWFVVTKVAEALGIRDHRVTRVARKLERNGFLSPVMRDDHGQPIGRQISAKLNEMLGA